MYQQMPPPSAVSNFTYSLKSNLKMVVFNIVLATITALVVAISCSLVLTAANIFLLKAIQLIAFVLLGILQVSYLHEKIFLYSDEEESEVFFFSVILAVFISLTLFVLYQQVDKPLIILGFASGAAFLLPAAVSFTFLNFTNFPEKVFPPWTVDPDVEDTVSIFLNSLNIEIQLAEKDSDNAETHYNIVLPGQTPFGNLFDRFVSKVNSNEPGTIELSKTKRKAFGWEFHIEYFGGIRKKYINPLATLRENKVKDKSIIIARRIGAGKKKQRMLSQSESTQEILNQ